MRIGVELPAAEERGEARVAEPAETLSEMDRLHVRAEGARDAEGTLGDVGRGHVDDGGAETGGGEALDAGLGRDLAEGGQIAERYGIAVLPQEVHGRAALRRH